MYTKNYIRKLCEEYRKGSKKALDELVNIYTPFILRVLESYGYSENEIIYGYYALINNAKLYNDSSNYNFEVPFYTHIKRQLIQMIKEQSNYKLKYEEEELLLKIKKFIVKYRKNYNEEVSIDEIAASFNIDSSTVVKLLYDGILLNEEKKLMYRNSLNDYTFDQKIVDTQYYKYLYEEICSLKALDDNSINMLNLRYGINCREHTLNEVAVEFRFNSKQSCAVNINKIKNIIRSSHVKSLYDDAEYKLKLKRFD